MVKLKYENGKDIFPADLLRRIQKYVSGKFVYIPSADKKRAWGETSGYKQYLADRNHEIKTKFHAGTGIETLSEEYHLSFDTIKKICQAGKTGRMDSSLSEFRRSQQGFFRRTETF